jgi:Protein of unknown function (DUF3152)
MARPARAVRTTPLRRRPVLVPARTQGRPLDPWWLELVLALLVVLVVGGITEIGETDERVLPIARSDDDEDGDAALAALPAEEGDADAPPSPAAPQQEDPATEKPVALNGTGKLLVVPGSTPTAGTGPLHTFIVEVEEGLGVDGQEFAQIVFETLTSERGWGESESFRRVDSGPFDFRVTLAGPNLTDELCLPHQTHGVYSCYESGRSVINFMRWTKGADSYGRDLRGYRTYLINHEVGHAIGYHAHESCPAPGEPAPIMMQQTKGVAPCTPNPWP